MQEVRPKFRLRKIYEARNYLLDEIKQNDLMSEKYKNTYKYLSYVKHLLIIASTVSGCVSISAFTSLVCVPIGITSSAAGINICAITAGIEKYNSVMKKKKKKKHYKTVLLGKGNLNTIEVLISKTVIDMYIVHGEFVPINNLKRLWNILYKNNKNVLKNCKKYTANKNSSVRKTKENISMLLSHCAFCSKKKTISRN